MITVSTSPYSSHSAEWSAVPKLHMKGEYNDNVLLTSLSHDPVYGVWTSPELRIKAETERLRLQGDIRLDFANYLNKENLDITQQFYTGTFSYRTETMEWGIRGNFSRDSVLRGELQDTGVIGELAVIERRRIRKRHQFDPSWTVNITEQSSLALNYRYADVEFLVPSGTGLFDYHAHSANGTLSHRFSEQNLAQIATQFLYFKSPTAGSQTVSYGGQLGLTSNLTETFVASILGGVQFVSTETSFGPINQDSDRAVWTVQGSLEQQYERLRIRGQGSRSINPSGAGVLVRTDRFSLSLIGNVTSKLTATLEGGLVFSDSIGNRAVSVPEARSYTVRPSLHWQWLEDLALGLSYRHRLIERKTSSVTTRARSNAIVVSLTYRFPRLATSE